MKDKKIRNIAIIAHVDHGKTTLTDGLIRQTLEIRNVEGLGNLIMDSMDQEQERGITIKAKNASIYYDYKGEKQEKGVYKINIVDTPGHADFGGEVERTLRMVDGVALLVDAQEGPMPQTKFVLKKAIELGHKVIVIINKVDKPAANPANALSKVEDLFLDLGADDNQMDFQTVYASGVMGRSGKDASNLDENLFYFLDKVIEEIPEPTIAVYEESQNINTLQILILALNYDSFKGKMGVGKITSGKITKNQTLSLIKDGGKIERSRASSLLVFDGLGLKEVEEAEAGEIVMVGGFDNVGIGDTITSNDFEKAIKRVSVDEPTIQMTFGVNTSPFSGKEGKLGTSRQIRERLYKELETNVALRVMDNPESSEKFIVSGRGELHLSVLIEAMRREGFELEVSKPEVIFIKDENGGLLEPFEFVEIDAPLEFQGIVMQELGKRGADIKNIQPNAANTEIRFELTIPTRSLIGLKSQLISETRGTVIMHALFDSYKPKVNIEMKKGHGSLVSTETGSSMAFALANAQLRGTLFIGPAQDVYLGMVIGQCSKDEDLELNPCKGKQLSNVRSSGNDNAISLTPFKIMSLENCLEYIDDDELLEVTPVNLRIRKRYLDPNDRKRNKRK